MYREEILLGSRDISVYTSHALVGDTLHAALCLLVATLAMLYISNLQYKEFANFAVDRVFRLVRLSSPPSSPSSVKRLLARDVQVRRWTPEYSLASLLRKTPPQPIARLERGLGSTPN